MFFINIFILLHLKGIQSGTFTIYFYIHAHLKMESVTFVPVGQICISHYGSNNDIKKIHLDILISRCTLVYFNMLKLHYTIIGNMVNCYTSTCFQTYSL